MNAIILHIILDVMVEKEIITPLKSRKIKTLIGLLNLLEVSGEVEPVPEELKMLLLSMQTSTMCDSFDMEKLGQWHSLIDDESTKKLLSDILKTVEKIKENI